MCILHNPIEAFANILSDMYMKCRETPIGSFTCTPFHGGSLILLGFIQHSRH